MANETLNSATIALSRYIASQSGRKIFAANNWQDETTLVPCNENETIGAVMKRARKNRPPVVIAVHYPARSGKDSFEFIVVNPGNISRAGDDDNRIGAKSTIGMFADSLQGRGAVTCQIGDWSAVQLGSYNLASV